MDYFALDRSVYHRLLKWYGMCDTKGFSYFGVWTVALERLPNLLEYCKANDPEGDVLGQKEWDTFALVYANVLKELEYPFGELYRLCARHEERYDAVLRKILYDDHVYVGDLLALPKREYGKKEELIAALGETGERLEDILERADKEYYGY